MKSLRAWFASRTGRLVLHDGSLAVAAAVAYLETTSQPIDRGVIIAASVVALKAFLRLILPVPAASGAGGRPKGRQHGYSVVELLVVVLLVLVILAVLGLLR